VESRHVRRMVADAGKRAGGRVARALDAGFGSRAGASFGILLYHRISPRPVGVPTPTLNVTPARLREQLTGLLADGFTFRPLGEVLHLGSTGQTVPVRTAVLTFDDGYENFVGHAWPVLSELCVPATVFVATSYVDSRDPFPFDPWGQRHHRCTSPDTWRPLTWEQCAELERSDLVEVGSHSHTHRNFRGRPAELHADLAASLRTLEERLGPGPRPFSFPFGSARGTFADEALVAAARDCGVTCALTTDIALADPGTSPLTWGRLEVSQADDSNTVRAKLNGWYLWMERAREAFRWISR
jgi:peptidoglycan/xylan/chitin deacetylase (PgdA/CDA1 family)